jgi:molybdate transport system ATP-binding protein
VLDAHYEVTLGSFNVDLSLESKTGETTVVLGESGSGKSTVLKLLSGLLKPDVGSFVLDDVVYDDTASKFHVPAESRPVGYVFQDYVLFPHLSVFDNVGFGLKMQGISKTLIEQRVGEALEQVHLVGYDDRRPKELSGGQQQRVAIARALALQPELLLLDESLSALDVQTRHEVERELGELLARLKVTTVMVSHQYSDALLFADHIVVLADGHVRQRGTHLDLLRNPASSYIAEMVRVNRFEGSVTALDPGSRGCRVALRGAAEREFEFDATAAGGGPNAEPLQPNQDISVVIHPRNVVLHVTAPESGTPNAFSGEISQVTPVSASFRPATGTMEGLMRVAVSLDPTLPVLTSEFELTADSELELELGKTIYPSFRALDAAAFPAAPARSEGERKHPPDRPDE